MVRLGVLLACLIAAPAQALPAETWLVAFANNRGEADEVGLLYAERDAQQVVDVLQQHSAVQPRRTTILLGASREQVIDTLLEVNARIRERSSHAPTALVVYYSGHADAEALHLGGTQLAIDEVKKIVQGSPAAMRLLIVDSCRSGSATRVKGIREATPFDLNLGGEAAMEGMAIVTSSTAGESSQESDALRGSFFTHHLVNALRGAADQDDDDRITLSEAYGYTYSQTLRSTGRTAVLQHPTYAFDVKGKGELILAQRADASGRLGRLRLADSATYIISEGREGGPVIAEVQPARDRATLALNAGSYFVQQRLASEYREYQVQVPRGAEVSLDALKYQTITYDRLVRKRGGAGAHTQGLFLLGAFRGETLEGEGSTPQLQLGYGVDLPWFTLGARLRGSTLVSRGTSGQLERRHSELGLGLAFQRFVDFPWFSISFGLLAEGVYHHQIFDEGDRIAPARHSLGASFGGIFSVERHLWKGLAVHVEGGPITLLYRQATVDAGPPEATAQFRSPFTYWIAAGVVWRR